MDITIGQAKILYKIVNGQSEFQPGDFGTTPETFQPVAAAIADLREKGLITTGEPHRESTSGNRYVDIIAKCRLTAEGGEELDRVTGDFLHSEGEFSLKEWQDDE